MAGRHTFQQQSTTMKQAILVILALSAGHLCQAQTWNENFENQPANVRYGSSNPTRIAYNAVRNFAVANVDYSNTRGDFHAIDASGRAHTIGAYVGGLRRLGKIDVQGHLSYQNRQDNDQSWNSTLWLLPDNPFILCDSVVGDATTEQFDMRAAAAYQVADRWNIALELGLRTGSRADQTDPRPRSVTSMLPVTVGADYRLTDSWNVGLATGVQFYNQIIEYTKGGTLTGVSHRYFVMKGMGDYVKRASGDEPGYKRDYKGTSYHVALSACWQPADGHLANFIEASLASNNQNATDGGTYYSFKAGDYTETVASLQERLSWRPASHTLHHFIVAASFGSGKGTWFDQKRELDLEHGGLVFYRELNKSAIHKSQRLTASLKYQLDLLRNDGRRDLSVTASAALNSMTRKHFLGETTPKQETQTLNLQLQAEKMIYINKVSLLAQVGGGYQMPQKQHYASGTVYSGEDNIDAAYTRRLFEYETAKCWNVGALVDASLPVSQKLTAGAYAGLNYRAYSGKNEYWQGYDGTHLTAIQAGLYVKF